MIARGVWCCSVPPSVMTPPGAMMAQRYTMATTPVTNYAAAAVPQSWMYQQHFMQPQLGTVRTHTHTSLDR